MSNKEKEDLAKAKQASAIAQQVFVDAIGDNIKSINRIINLYDNQYTQEAKTYLGIAHEMIVKGLSANE